jgi:NADPH-dependent curcumin reductase
MHGADGQQLGIRWRACLLHKAPWFRSNSEQPVMTSNRVCKLVKRPPPGLVSRDSFEFVSEPVPLPGPGQFRVRIEYISLDPAMRGWMNDARSYIAPVPLGAVMRAYAAGHIDASNHPEFMVGAAVQGVMGVQQYALSDGKGIVKVDTSQAPLERWIGGLGMPGWTAYFGLLEVGKPQPGETVVVSAASGAVGSLVGQIARLKGCRAVGIAGGSEKCRYVVEELGFDACVDYKSGELATALKAAAPRGIDVYFENVGGEILDTVLLQMNTFGRIALCGLISTYNATAMPGGPKNLRVVLTQRLTMRGLIVFDWADRIPEANRELGAWHKAGKLTMREDVRTGGIDAYPDVLNLLYTGGNLGKLVLSV